MQNKNSSHLDGSAINVTSYMLYDSSKKNEFETNSIIDNSSLTKTVLFVCDLCDGPLVPSSLCTVCKKTATRVCVKCGNAKKTNTHTTCCDLLLLGSMIRKDLHKVDNA